MKTYVLVFSAGIAVSSQDMDALIGNRYRNISAMGEAVGHILGTDSWELYSAEEFCECWNTYFDSIDMPDPTETYIAIVEVEHDE